MAALTLGGGKRRRGQPRRRPERGGGCSAGPLETCPRWAAYRSPRLSGAPQPGPARGTGTAQPFAGGYSCALFKCFLYFFLLFALFWGHWRLLPACRSVRREQSVSLPRDAQAPPVVTGDMSRGMGPSPSSAGAEPLGSISTTCCAFRPFMQP